MENLKILALGRNQIKKIENLDSVAETLEELWISYNLLERLVSVLFCLPIQHACSFSLKQVPACACAPQFVAVVFEA